MKILVTGAAGFIGFHLSKKLVREGHEVIGLDNINDYYDTQLKKDRLAQLGIEQSKINNGQKVSSEEGVPFQFVRMNLSDKKGIDGLFEEEDFDAVVNLAAQAGV